MCFWWKKRAAPRERNCFKNQIIFRIYSSWKNGNITGEISFKWGEITRILKCVGITPISPLSPTPLLVKTLVANDTHCTSGSYLCALESLPERFRFVNVKHPCSFLVWYLAAFSQASKFGYPDHQTQCSLMICLTIHSGTHSVLQPSRFAPTSGDTKGVLRSWTPQLRIPPACEHPQLT